MGITFGGDEPDNDDGIVFFDVDKVLAFLSRVYEMPRPRWIIKEDGEYSYFQRPDLLVFLEEDLCLHTVIHEFGHYLFYWTTHLKFKYLTTRGEFEDYTWDDLARCLVDKHTTTNPLGHAEEAWCDEFSASVYDSFKELKPKYTKMFGLIRRSEW